MSTRLNGLATSIAHLHARLRDGGLAAVLIRGASGTAAANMLGAALALLAQIALARLLGVTQYGYYVYAFTWMLILAQVCRLGFQTSLTRFTATYRTEGDWGALRGIAVRSGLLATAAALAAGVALVAVTEALGDGIAAAQLHTFRIAALAIVPLTLLGITQGLLRGYRRPAKAILPFRTFVHGGTLVLALAAAATTGLASAPAAMTLTLVATSAGLAISLGWTWQALSPDIASVQATHRTRCWLRTSLPLLLMSGMHILMKQTDTVMLGAITGTDSAGLYFPASRISELAMIGMISINAIAAPMITELHTQGARARLQRLLTMAAAGTTAVTLAAVVVFAVAGHWVLAIFGDAFPPAYPALMILLIGQTTNALCGPASLMMSMTGHQNRASLVLTCGAMLNLALNAILIPPFGLIGAAAATAASTAVWNLWLLAEVVRRHALNPSVFRRPWSSRTLD